LFKIVAGQADSDDEDSAIKRKNQHTKRRRKALKRHIDS
jgi:hypothetical protein